jgi:RNA polymerase sigma factor (sigma-70 family)
MADIRETIRQDAGSQAMGEGMRASDLQGWFVLEVLPLEAALTQFLRHNWRNNSDIADLVQEIYLRVFEAAQRQRPDNTKSFVFATAQNLLIDRVRREKIVPFEAMLEPDALAIAGEEPSPDRAVIARDELRRLQSALDGLPARCREAIVMKQVNGLTRREIATRMGISEKTVKWYLADGLRTLADNLYGEPPGSKS